MPNHPANRAAAGAAAPAAPREPANNAHAAPAHHPDQALQRFIELAQRDAEDEWDSDELPDELGFGDGDSSDDDDDLIPRGAPRVLVQRIPAREGGNRLNRR